MRASTSTGYVGRLLRRQVSRRDSIRSTQRSPFSLKLPCIIRRLEDGKAKSSLSSFFCGLNAIFNQKDPKISHLPVQMFCEPARLILSTPVLVNQMTHAGVPCGNLSLSRRCIGPLNRTAKLGGDSLAKPGDHRVLSLSKTYRFAYEMGKTGVVFDSPTCGRLRNHRLPESPPSARSTLRKPV